jgi:hypothetical protein
VCEIDFLLQYVCFSSRVDDEDDDFFVDDQEVNRLIIVTQVRFQNIPCSCFCLVICFL